MTYRELQKALKIARNVGLTTIKLNRKKLELQAEYNRIISRPIEVEAKPEVKEKATTQDLLSAIKKLAPQHENYIPMHVLRERINLSRQDFNNELFALQRQDEIELSSYCYNPQYAAAAAEYGIEQQVGGNLFYVTLGAIPAAI